jgi:hypothetical protein
MADLLINVLHFISPLEIGDIVKIAVLCFVVFLMYPISRAYFSVYDITVINRLADPYKFSTCKAETGDIGIKGGMDRKIAPGGTQHFQIVPSWRALFKSDTRHIIIKKSDAKKSDAKKSDTKKSDTKKNDTDTDSECDIINLLKNRNTEKRNTESVIIPVYNSGDIRRSRVFFIEKDGVRESGTIENDTWTWTRWEDHHFGQQGN